MEIIICCPECGNENLEFATPLTVTTFKCKCGKVFHISECGYNTKDNE